MRNHILFVLILFFASLEANNYELANLTNNDGLSNSSINTIFQGSNGLMWFGTWDGLNVYNGREFKVYKPIPEDENSISNNIIREIIEEKGSAMWIATDMGINRLDTKSNKFDRFFVDARNRSVTGEHFFLLAKNNSDKIFSTVFEQGLFYFNPKANQFVKLSNLKNLSAKKIFFDLDDNLWIFTHDKRLYKIVFKKDNQTAPEIESIVPFVHGKNVENIFYHNNNELWFQTSDNRLFSYRISAGLLSEHKGDLNSVGSIRSMLFFNGYELLGSSNGLFRYTNKTGILEPLQTNVSVLSLWAGTQQIVWVGTDMQGVYQLSPSRENFHNYSSENTTLFGHSAVRTFFEEKDGTLWVGTKGSGIYIFRQSGSSTQLSFAHKYDISGGLLSSSVFTIVPGYGSEYWIGTDGRGLNYYDCRTRQIRTLYIADHLKRNVNLTSVYSVLPADANTLWVGTSGYGMYKLVIDRSTSPYSVKSYTQYVYSPKRSSSISNNIVYSIIRDDNDHLWIATRGGGLNRFNIKKETFQTFRFSSDNPGFISSDDILCLYKDHDGVLWAGTSMGLNKLIRFQNGKPVFARFTEKEGMPNNMVHGILEDSEHNLWLSTNKGIAKIIPKNNDIRIISYLKKDGLQNNEFSDGAFYKSPYTGHFYFGGISGFNVFNPLEITYSNFVPSLILDAFFVDNVPTNLADLLQTRKKQNTLVLSYRNKSFSFRFVPIDYLSGSKCEISYQIEGYQKDWIQLGTSNTIVITNLPKGNYVLKVRCSNADKLWSDQLYVLPIKMLPPWWASNIAYLCYFMLLVAVFFGVWRFIKYQMSVKSAIRMKELDKQKTEEIHQAKLRFFTNIAHEFSNSLTLIYGPCERLLQNHITDGATRKYINIIKSNSERMQTLIQQLIDFRKAETGHLRLMVEKVDIAELVKFVLDNFLDILEQKKIRFSLHFQPDSIMWKTDRNSLEKVIFNLISNAVKYTPADESVEIVVDTNNDNLLKIRITNTGVGIREKYQKTIFDRFEVLERFEKQVSKGLETRNGIGLALCKNIIGVLQGTISVESDGETFTTFVVTLPELEISENNNELSTINILIANEKEITEEIDHDDTEQPETETLPVQGKPHGLVLVIDDDREIRRFIHDFLSEKYEIAEASNGQEAIEIMKHQIPQIIVCDIIMPVMDGVEFLKIMKGQELTRHIPVILLSSKSTIENQIEGIEVGADAYLGKPFHPRHLEVIISNLLHRNKAILDYSESPYMAVEQFEGKLVKIEDKDLITNATQIIYQHLDNEKLSMDFLSNELAMSKMQLYRKMKDIIELTPTEYIRSVRLKQAEKLLKTTNKTVQEIMYSCGFNNKTYFYREFAKKYHLTPKEYRNKK
jgi:signal transduction histidine kinase/ligand-binding sensor domain-containing protein/DNA-binding response OmpR family regulator